MSKVTPIILGVTTMNADASKAFTYFSSFADKDCHVYISHQITDLSIKPLDIEHPFVFYSSIQGSGLSRNRNNILDQVDEGIYVVCDDDVRLVDDFKQIIRENYSDKKNSCITFQSMSEQGLRKTYKKKSFGHSKVSILGVSSIEITFDVSDIKRMGLKFDELFGLGADTPSGEENIFLKDCLDAGLECRYMPKVINIHFGKSSGQCIDWSVKKKIFERMYGSRCGILFLNMFRVKKFFLS